MSGLVAEVDRLPVHHPARIQVVDAAPIEVLTHLDQLRQQQIPNPTYAVLWMAEAPADDQVSQERLLHQADVLNQACDRYERAVPYFSAVRLNDGRKWLVYGWRNEVTGVLASDFPQTRKRIRNLSKHQQKLYPQAAWIDVEVLRSAINHQSEK